MRKEHVGTYVQCFRFGCPQYWVDDADLVLYLLPSGHFLYISSWRRFELTVAAGDWQATADEIQVRGEGRTLLYDAFPYSCDPWPFIRTFTVGGKASTPILTTVECANERGGASHFDHSGPFSYLGQHRVFPLDEEQLPTAWRDIDPWIEHFLGLPS